MVIVSLLTCHCLQADGPERMVFGGFRSGLALFDMDNDGDLDCVSTVTEDFDESVPSVTYVWLLNAVNGHKARNISFYVRGSDTPGEFLFKDKNADGPLQSGTYLYSDYKDCLILEMPYGSSQECMMWISWEVKDQPPQDCTDQYQDKCEIGKLAFDDATCSPFFS
ncbi:uncharacterized protein [Dermacentor albipictus]|uniref:uncharacterized protein n=1 Tax=Dermacentor albipictus TaxID=60249 RepID=UPI0031FE42A3